MEQIENNLCYLAQLFLKNLKDEVRLYPELKESIDYLVQKYERFDQRKDSVKKKIATTKYLFPLKIVDISIKTLVKILVSSIENLPASLDGFKPGRPNCLIPKNLITNYIPRYYGGDFRCTISKVGAPENELILGKSKKNALSLVSHKKEYLNNKTMPIIDVINLLDANKKISLRFKKILSSKDFKENNFENLLQDSEFYIYAMESLYIPKLFFIDFNKKNDDSKLGILLNSLKSYIKNSYTINKHSPCFFKCKDLRNIETEGFDCDGKITFSFEIEISMSYLDRGGFKIIFKKLDCTAKFDEKFVMLALDFKEK
ncbi:hypothetical protein EDEG_00782 [Edhazardia aedis USNM 41457]|uniref:Uncharacterized protein n=1 Tax=Edhazardia aedis (strain USNM 41457) TaxID=1003232 RepID=J9DV11_EDHAE|nr:hypothetical protein EDEG_00782 [Edhazardia aedis USNM 41457]|eukprot:EJW05112.1 hypothetical protein EDEG_00782 [Edhazardia aedis USNM 41457]